MLNDFLQFLDEYGHGCIIQKSFKSLAEDFKWWYIKGLFPLRLISWYIESDELPRGEINPISDLVPKSD